MISGIAEGARDLIVSKLSLVGDKAKNYTLVGESHKFLVKLNERFKAKTEITKKLNSLQRSGKKSYNWCYPSNAKGCGFSSSTYS